MRIICGPAKFNFAPLVGDVEVVLFEHSKIATQGSVGAAVMATILRQKLDVVPRAWDFLSIALSVVAADLAGHRDKSTDGWTREFELHIAVADATFWSSQVSALEEALLKFLTTDRWHLKFVEGGEVPTPNADPVRPPEDCVALLSGGLDSFVGVLDLSASGKKPFAVSQSVRGDAEKQRQLSSTIGGGLRHLQLNHNAVLPEPENPPSQRARSIVFLAYGIAAATTLAKYQKGEEVVLYLCENGFITINPPLTPARVGSLSTRTSHPVVLALLKKILDAAGIRVRIENPYRHKTKGEMLTNCQNQTLLKVHAHETTSCGRFKRFGYRHCGRCIPCLIRRAAFCAWGVADKTVYVHDDISVDDAERARFDDIRAAAMAIEQVKEVGLDRWLGATFSSPLLPERAEFKDVVNRGLSELGTLLKKFGVK